MSGVPSPPKESVMLASANRIAKIMPALSLPAYCRTKDAPTSSAPNAASMGKNRSPKGLMPKIAVPSARISTPSDP